MPAKLLRFLAVLVAPALLGGCQQFVVLFPAGYVAEQQRDLLVASVVLMLVIIVPLFAAIAWIAWRYREHNPRSAYAPEWEHSTKLELLIWAAPLAIVVVLGAMTWIGTHLLDPYSSLTRIDDQQPLPEKLEPVQIDVVALNWKWLFLYPQYGIATVGEVAAPVNVPLHFRITATDIMNSFYIPTLAGQIYAMPGMQTQLIAVINETGTYQGISANYSGEGFNYMDFDFLGMTEAKFKQWVAQIKNGANRLTRERFQALAKPSVDVPVQYYADYADGLFRTIVLECFQAGAGCAPQPGMHDEKMHHIKVSTATDVSSADASMN
ncbi:MAG: ubiquinol oxidase subunit II [Salinisphaera sp.]|nr:ubiquinol oxidase subunit II [Salinisphaera sp.]